MDGHRREEGAGADVEPREGGAEEPERDERGGVDVDDREDESGEKDRGPDGHDFGQATEEHATEEQLFEDGRLDENENEENRLAAQGKGVGRDELDKVLVGEVDVGEAGEQFAARPVEAERNEADGEGGKEGEVDEVTRDT